MILSDVLSPEQRRRNMQAIKSKETKLEIKVANALWHRGLRLRKNVKNLYGKPDISIKKYKIVIFIDSCFWHGCEEHGHIPKSNEEFWKTKIDRNKQRDRIVTEYYIQKNWHIFRIWEHELKNDFQNIITNIVDVIKKIKNSPRTPD